MQLGTRQCLKMVAHQAAPGVAREAVTVHTHDTLCDGLQPGGVRAVAAQHLHPIQLLQALGEQLSL